MDNEEVVIFAIAIAFIMAVGLGAVVAVDYLLEPVESSPDLDDNHDYNNEPNWWPDFPEDGRHHDHGRQHE